jgi:hypothetical protein
MSDGETTRPKLSKRQEKRIREWSTKHIKMSDEVMERSEEIGLDCLP